MKQTITIHFHFNVCYRNELKKKRKPLKLYIWNRIGFAYFFYIHSSQSKHNYYKLQHWVYVLLQVWKQEQPSSFFLQLVFNEKPNGTTILCDLFSSCFLLFLFHFQREISDWCWKWNIYKDVSKEICLFAIQYRYSGFIFFSIGFGK